MSPRSGRCSGGSARASCLTPTRLQPPHQLIALTASQEEYDECAAATAKAWETYAAACAAREEDADAVLDAAEAAEAATDAVAAEERVQARAAEQAREDAAEAARVVEMQKRLAASVPVLFVCMCVGG